MFERLGSPEMTARLAKDAGVDDLAVRSVFSSAPPRSHDPPRRGGSPRSAPCRHRRVRSPPLPAVSVRARPRGTSHSPSRPISRRGAVNPPRSPGRKRAGPEAIASETALEIEQLLAAKEVVVACGPGGVGKTTTAAALAATVAAHMSGRVLVLTVDPARRLADALGIRGIGNQATRVPSAAFTAAGVTPKGELYAAMLDMSESWDALVRRHAPDTRTARADPGEPAVPEHQQAFRTGSGLHRDGEAVRAP